MPSVTPGDSNWYTELKRYPQHRGCGDGQARTRDQAPTAQQETELVPTPSPRPKEETVPYKPPLPTPVPRPPGTGCSLAAGELAQSTGDGRSCPGDFPKVTPPMGMGTEDTCPESLPVPPPAPRGNNTWPPRETLRDPPPAAYRGSCSLTHPSPASPFPTSRHYRHSQITAN